MSDADAAAVRIEDERFAIHLRNALHSCAAADAVALIDLDRRDVRQGAGDREGMELLHALGVAIFNPDGADASERDYAGETFGAGQCWTWGLDGCHALPLAGTDATLVLGLTVGTAFPERRRLFDCLRFDDAAGALAAFARLAELAPVGRALLQAGNGGIQTYRRAGSERSQNWRGFDHCVPAALLAEARRWMRGEDGGAGDRRWIRAATRSTDDTTARWLRLPYSSNLLVAVSAPRVADLTPAALVLCNDVLRDIVAQMLAAGLKTEVDPFPQSAAAFNELLRRLRELPPDDLVNRLVLGGFADHPLGDGEDRMRCAECIYFLRNRRWCDLPELPIPVEPDWFCRLWRM